MDLTPLLTTPGFGLGLLAAFILGLVAIPLLRWINARLKPQSPLNMWLDQDFADQPFRPYLVQPEIESAALEVK